MMAPPFAVVVSSAGAQHTSAQHSTKPYPALDADSRPILVIGFLA
jgi:hypothetical protein